MIWLFANMAFFDQQTIITAQVGFDPRAMLHAMYVGFVFACTFFGALAYRQILDNLEVKRMKMGEDRDSFVDALSATALILLWCACLIVAIVCYALVRPSIYSYSLPLILGAQVLQFTLRILFQRTLVKTKGLVVRSVFFEKSRAIPFAEIVAVRFVKHSSWTSVIVGLSADEVGFRIFSFSAETLERIISASCNAPVLWSYPGSDEHQKHPPVSGP